MKSVWRLGFGITSINRFGDSGSRFAGRFASVPRYISSRSSKTEKLGVEKVSGEHAARKSVKAKSNINENTTGAKENKPESKPRSSNIVGEPSSVGGESSLGKKAEASKRKASAKGEATNDGDSEEKKQVKTRVKKVANDENNEVPVEKKPVKRTNKAEASEKPKAPRKKTSKASGTQVGAQEQVHEASETLKQSINLEVSEEHLSSQSLEVAGNKIVVQLKEEILLKTSGTREEVKLVTAGDRKPDELKVEKTLDEDGVDEELREFLHQRKLKNEEPKPGVEDEEDVEVDYIWDFRNIKFLPDSIKLLEKKLRELTTTSTPHDRRTAVVKLKLALELTNESTERSVDLATEALKVFGIDDSMEQGTCLSVLGAGYRKLGHGERSLSLLRRALKYFEEKEEKGLEVLNEKQFVLNELGMTLLSLNRRKEAVQSLVESLELLEAIISYGDPELGSEYRKVATLLAEAEEWDEAKTLCEKAIRIHSRSKGFENSQVGEDRKELAKIFEGLKQHEEALEQLRIVKQIFSGEPEIVHWSNMKIADALLAMKSFSQAIATLEGALDSAPKLARGSVYLKLAKALRERKNLDEAHKNLAACMNFYKENLEGGDVKTMADDVHEVAELFGELGDHVASGKALRIAIAAYDCVPGGEMMVVDSKLEMASHLTSQGSDEAALKFCKEALELAERMKMVSAKALTMTAGAHIKLGQIEAAMELLCRALDRTGDEDEEPEERSLYRASAHRHLVSCHRYLQRFDEAIKHQKLLISELQMLGDGAEREVLEARRLLEELESSIHPEAEVV